jgi:hypothetical protein
MRTAEDAAAFRELLKEMHREHGCARLSCEQEPQPAQARFYFTVRTRTPSRTRSLGCTTT